MSGSLRRKAVALFMSYWPPYLGAGVRIKKFDFETLTVEVDMVLRFWNQNYVGTQFGGSLYSMCDPFFMLLLMEALGPDYIVWDKAAAIRFKKPGQGRVSASFQIPPEQVESIRELLKTERKVEPMFQVQVFNDQGEVIAEVDKTLYVRRRSLPSR